MFKIIFALVADKTFKFGEKSFKIFAAFSPFLL